MNTLREAAQAVLNDYDRGVSIVVTERVINRLRAALAQPETAEPVAWQRRYILPDGPYDWQDCAPEDVEYYRSGVELIEVRPLYTRPPRDEWRPASEPPEDGRQVLGWQKRGYWDAVHFLNGNWFVEATGRHTLTITHWRDVQPPTESTIATEIAAARDEVKTWPKWMQDAARASAVAVPPTEGE